jgi:uracil-DNA glycosylase
MEFLRSLFEMLPSCWHERLSPFLDTVEAKKLELFLLQQYQKGRTIYPQKEFLFNAFKFTPFDAVKVVILGQDPYHQPNQAHGISFSVPNTTQRPPSLKNILKELVDDLQCPLFQEHDLTPWAKQGVLLLNCTLSVEKNLPLSHTKVGWEVLTDTVIKLLSKRDKKCIFVLWGAKASQKLKLIDQFKHKVFESAHPSPLSAYRGFFGSKVFSKINLALKEAQLEPIIWPLI